MKKKQKPISDELNLKKTFLSILTIYLLLVVSFYFLAMKARPEKFDNIAGLYDRRLVSSRDVSERLDVSQKTFLKWFYETHCA